ncbi:MAG TPA: hypothetical protein VNO70_05685 [Blastocatellia bacterium]|nr:hypothetical protein [Blastocatellia bacterium]
MKLTSDEMKALYQERTSRSARQQTECPTPDALLRAASGEISRAEREALADHLMACSDCAHEYRLLRPLPPPSEPLAAPEAKALPNLRAVPSRPADKRGGDAKKPARWRWLAGMFSPRRLPYALAAPLLALTLTLGMWNVSLRQESRRTIAQFNEQLTERDRAISAATESLEQAQRRLEDATRRSEEFQSELAELRRENAELARSAEELSRPQLNPAIADLDPRDSVRGGAGAVRTVEIPSGARLFTLILNITGQPPYSDYALEIRNANNKLIWQGQGLKRSAENTFTVALTRQSLPPGQYRFRLFGLRGNQRELVEDYVVRIRYS